MARNAYRRDTGSISRCDENSRMDFVEALNACQESAAEARRAVAMSSVEDRRRI